MDPLTDTANTAGAFSALHDAQFMLLTTHRRDGSGVATTVWFAQVGDRLYVTTMEGAGKAKRIRAGGQVTVAPSSVRGDVLGPAADGQGRVLDRAEFATAEAALRTKYPEYDEFTGRMAAQTDPNARIFLEIRPAGE